MSKLNEKGNTMHCYTHDKREAIGTCISCGKPICEECKVEVSGKYYCKNCISQNEQKVRLVIGEKELTSTKKVIAILITFLLPGIGHIFLGKPYDNKGYKLLVGAIISAILMIILIGFLLYVAILIYALVDLAKIETVN